MAASAHSAQTLLVKSALHHWRSAVSAALALLLVLMLACGAAATPSSQRQAPPSGSGALPTLVPQPVPATAASPAVNPGTVTWMVGNWEGARMTNLHVVNPNYGNLLHSFLVSTNEKRDLIPGLASQWEVSADGKTWTFTIREGAKFHDGRPVTAADAVFTWNHAWGPGSLEKSTSSTTQNQGRNFESAQLVDDRRASLTTKKVDASIPYFVGDAVGSVQGIVLPRWPADKIHNDAQILAYEQSPVGAGVMKLYRHVPSEVMQFERFEDFYMPDRRPKFRYLDLRQVPEEATRIAALRAGEADIAPISLSSRAQLESAGGRVVFGPEGTYLYARFREPWITDYPTGKREVRQALAYALDLRIFRDKLFGPEVYVSKGWNNVTPSALGYSPELDPYPFDPVKARQLLAQAGYPEGKGFPLLIVNTWTSRATPLLPESAQIAADMWRRELGIPVEVRLGDEAKFKQDWITEGALRGQILWRDNETRVDAGNIVRGTFGTPTAPGRQTNDPAIFKQAQEAVAILDREKRAQAYNQLYRVLKEDVGEIALGYQNIPWGVGSRVKQWAPMPMAFWVSGLHTIVLK